MASFSVSGTRMNDKAATVLSLGARLGVGSGNVLAMGAGAVGGAFVGLTFARGLSHWAFFCVGKQGLQTGQEDRAWPEGSGSSGHEGRGPRASQVNLGTAPWAGHAAALSLLFLVIVGSSVLWLREGGRGPCGDSIVHLRAALDLWQNERLDSVHPPLVFWSLLSPEGRRRNAEVLLAWLLPGTLILAGLTVALPRYSSGRA